MKVAHTPRDSHTFSRRAGIYLKDGLVTLRFSGMDRITFVPAPMSTSEPIVISPRIITLVPTSTRSPINGAWGRVGRKPFQAMDTFW